MSDTERRNAFVLCALIALGAIDRWVLLVRFGFRYIGIDDALVQGVAVDMGHGLFREPFLYGQNYNPMLEALLAAPFVRLGGAPWIVLPLVTSLLALLPFWSLAVWCFRRQAHAAALVLAAWPILLPVEWGLITTQPRGFVHGLAVLALLPWAIRVDRRALRYALIGGVLAAAFVCNPNTLPLLAGIGIVSCIRHAREPVFWGMGLLGAAPALCFHWAAKAFYVRHPERVVHVLTPGDLAFDPALLRSGLLHWSDHFLHLSPFGLPTAPLAVLVVISTGLFLLWRYRTAEAMGILGALLVMVLALGIVKVHEGCASVFFPLSRMFLAWPLLLGCVAALWVQRISMPRWSGPALAVIALAWTVSKAASTKRIVDRELAEQACAYVREEPLADVALHCRTIAEAATAQHADVVVPIRWPHIRTDHALHFTAHFTCYACPQLVPDFPPAFGPGHDRRSWVRERYADAPPGRVLFVGGDPQAWAIAMREHPGIVDVSANGLLLHALTSDTASVERTIGSLGVDDDPAR